MKQLSNRELARQATAAGRKISEGGIRNAIAKGKVPKNPTLQQLLDGLRDNTTFQKGGDTTGGKSGGTLSEFANLPIKDKTANTESRQQNKVGLNAMSLAEVRLATEKVRLAEANLDLQVKQATLTDTAGVKNAAMIAGRMTREAIEAIPAKVSAELASCNDVKTVTLILEREIRNALAQVAEQLGGV
jgi:hypothetical protein